MNVLHIIDTLDLGGAQVIVKGIAESKKEGFVSHIFALRKTDITIAIDQKYVTVFGCKSRFSFRPIKTLRDYVMTNEIEVLHCHLFRSQLFGFLLKKIYFPNVKLIFHEHGPLFEKGESWFVAFLLRISKKSVDQFIAVSEITKKLLVEKGKIPVESVKVLYNFIDLEKHDLNLTELGNSGYEKGKLEEKPFMVGYAARLVYRKGWRTLIDSLKYLKDESLMVFIAGEGSERKKLQKVIQKAGLEHRVKSVGYIADMKKFYSSIDCFVIPSYWEPFGLTALEAQAAGVPLIASDIPGLNEVVNQENAMMFAPKNSAALAERISALKRDAALRQKLIASGRQNVKQFDKKCIIDRLYMGIYSVFLNIEN